jgi:3-oxoacyl-[acyl-carrier-protein] synthase III
MKKRNYPRDQVTVTQLQKQGLKPEEIDKFLSKQFKEMWQQATDFMEMQRSKICLSCGHKLNGEK